jgi:predicted enzyme related to lactoylglutathione lyase
VQLVQIAQHAEDLDRATRFYTELFGTGPVASYPPGLVFFDLGGVRLLLDAAAPSALHYYPVPDIDAAVERLRAGGAELDSAPHVIFSHEDATLGPAGTDEWMAFVTDSEGNTVGLVSHAASAS